MTAAAVIAIVLAAVFYVISVTISPVAFLATIGCAICAFILLALDAADKW